MTLIPTYPAVDDVRMGIQLHRKYASRYLIDLLSKIGVSVAYSKCLAFENSAITNNKDNVPEDSFIQFVFDNADINIRTIDGHGTFHSMWGIIRRLKGKRLQSCQLS